MLSAAAVAVKGFGPSEALNANAGSDFGTDPVREFEDKAVHDELLIVCFSLRYLALRRGKSRAAGPYARGTRLSVLWTTASPFGSVPRISLF